MNESDSIKQLLAQGIEVKCIFWLHLGCLIIYNSIHLASTKARLWFARGEGCNHGWSVHFWGRIQIWMVLETSVEVRMLDAEGDFPAWSSWNLKRTCSLYHFLIPFQILYPIINRQGLSALQMGSSGNGWAEGVCISWPGC